MRTITAGPGARPGGAGLPVRPARNRRPASQRRSAGPVPALRLVPAGRDAGQMRRASAGPKGPASGEGLVLGQTADGRAIGQVPPNMPVHAARSPRPGVPGARSGLPGARSGLPEARSGVPGARSGVPGARSGVPGARSGLPEEGARRRTRLTRRGRILAAALVVAVMVTVAVLAWLAGTTRAQAALHGSPPGAVYRNLTQVVVRPGQTLWTIASQAQPTADPRTVVQEIVTLNDLRGVVIEPGQHLWVPRK
jgi:LysM domain